MTTPSVTERITAYLCGGGLFNPEYANHDAVRDLLIDAKSDLAARDAELAAMKQGKVLADGMANMIRGFILKTVERETLDEAAAKYRKWEEDYCHSTPAKLDRAIAAEQRAVAAEREVKRLIEANEHWHTRIEQEKSLREAAERERDSAVSWNHRVSVCANHTAEIVDGPCVICELEAAERKAEENAKDAKRIDAMQYGMWFVEPDYSEASNWRVGKVNYKGVPLHSGKTLRTAIDAAIATKGEA